MKITDSQGKTSEGTCNTSVSTATVAAAPKPNVAGASTACKTVTVCIDQTGEVTQSDPQKENEVTPTQTPVVSKTNGDSAVKSSLASIFSANGGTWDRIKSLLKWYLAILGIILVLVFGYFGIRRLTGKEVK